MVFDHIFKVIFRYFEKTCGDLAINEDGQENIIPGSAHQKIVEEDGWATYLFWCCLSIAYVSEISISQWLVNLDVTRGTMYSCSLLWPEGGSAPLKAASLSWCVQFELLLFDG